MTGSIPMINSILHTEEQAFWKKLPDKYELAQLHRKFWVQGEYDNLLNVEEDAAEDDEGAAKVTEGAIGFVEGAAENNDDVGPECYVLDLGSPEPGRSKLWVRKEFIRMYERCKDHFKTHRGAAESPSLVVTGQPGIGKSYWILYVLCRRLAYKKPVMWYRGHRLYLFVEDGVYLAPKDYPSTEFRTRVWTLVDSDESNIFPESLAVPDTKHMIVFVSSPKEERWKGMTQTTTCAVAIMNPWTRREISEAAAIHGLAGDDPAIDEMYTRFGPTARICFNYLKTPALLDRHERNLRNALSGLSLRSFQKMINNTSNLNMDDVSHTILLMKRYGSDLSLEPITPIVEGASKSIQNGRAS